MATESIGARPHHVIAVVGGAVAGSEAAAYCADRGALVFVLEAGNRPYGKIEDGLPRWHDKLRQQEYARIDENLARPGVHLLRRTRLGEDISLEELREMGVSAVLLATGAWRDRPLPLPDIERFVGRGLVYQNAFIHWFNHYEEPDYAGPEFPILDGTIVIGGGLASIDVVKAINLELYARALRARGHDIDIIKLEQRGIPETLEALGLSVEELGIEGGALYYRRRREDMPIASPSGDDPAALAKAETARVKIMARLERKYLVRFVELASPIAPLEQDGQLVGLRFQRNRLHDGKVEPIPGETCDIRAPMVISSIGSIPRPIPGVPTKGELYDYADESTGELRGLPGVYGLGNVLTGKGNIKDSRENASTIAAHISATYLGLEGTGDANPVGDEVRAQAHRSAEAALSQPPVSDETLAEVERFIAERGQAVG